jgi:putative redox protein
MNGLQNASSTSASRTVTVDGDGDSASYLQKISVGPHLLHADELDDVGGNDLGPSPYELLLAALGACIGITLRMYADRKQWPLQTVHVDLSHRKIPIEDGEENGAKSGIVDRIDVGVSVTGNLTEEQRSRLLEIADKCPVHRTLVSEVRIQTTTDTGDVPLEGETARRSEVA